MNYKLISIDFDGTLLTSDKKVTSTTKMTLNKAHKNGYIIVGVTGRNFNSANSACDIDMFDYLILNNGAYIYDVKSKSYESIEHLSKKFIIDIFHEFKGIAYAIDFCSYDKYFMYREKVDNKKDFLIKISDVNDINEDICRINIFIRDDVIDLTNEHINKKYGNIVNSFIMMDSDDTKGNKWIAIQPKNITKGNSIKKLCDNIGLSTEECIFFGDGPNDIEALETVGLGVAMGNAFEEVKKKSKDVTLSNDEDGVSSYLVKKLNI